MIISGGGRLRPLVGVSAGGRFSLAWGRSPASAVGWGACAHGQLGQAAVSDVDVEGGEDGEDGEDGGVQFLPRLLAPLGGEGGGRDQGGGGGGGAGVNGGGHGGGGGGGGELVAVVAGWQHAGAIVARLGDCSSYGDLGGGGAGAGVALFWGCGEGGVLGDGTLTVRPQPCTPGGSLAGRTVRLIGCGREVSAAVDNAGRLHAWGRLSGGAVSPAASRASAAAIALPRELQLTGGVATITQLVCAGRRVVVLVAPRRDSDSDRAVAGGAAGSHDAAGSDAAALHDGAAVWECNGGSGGGGGGPPRPLRSLEGQCVCAIAAGADITLALTSDGRCLRLGGGGGSSGGGGGGSPEELPLPGDARPRLLSAAKSHAALTATHVPPAPLAAAATAASAASMVAASSSLSAISSSPSTQTTPFEFAAVRDALGADATPGFMSNLPNLPSRPSSRPNSACDRPVWLQ